MSKLIVFEFQCSSCDAITDELVQPTVYETVCSACGGTARRIVSAVRLDPHAFVHGPTASEPAIDKWCKIRKKKMDIEQKKLRDHGTYD